MQVERREGGGLQPVLEPTTDTSGAGLDWMTYIRPARDRHEQNVEVVLDCRTVGGGFRLRTSRVVKPGDELFVWYGDQLALDLGVPVLAPANIRGIPILLTIAVTSELSLDTSLFAKTAAATNNKKLIRD